MKEFIREYLTFNKRERNGLLVLVFIIALQLIYLTFSYKFVSNERVDFTKFENEIATFEASLKNEHNSYEVKNKITKSTENLCVDKNMSINYFVFNPNNLPINKWKLLGLSDKQIKVIKKYETKGGKFYTKLDLKKMYCISENQYAKLEPYINIQTKVSADPQSIKLRPTVTNTVLVELNTADSITLISLNGIGSFYANAIIKYRKQLGGFYSKQQLLELWKFDENKFKSIENKIRIDSEKIQKLNINTCDSKQLKHPYLKWNQVNGIINYRNKHGKYKSIEEINNTDLIDDLTFQKISNYLTIE